MLHCEDSVGTIFPSLCAGTFFFVATHILAVLCLFLYVFGRCTCLEVSLLAGCRWWELLLTCGYLVVSEFQNAGWTQSILWGMACCWFCCRQEGLRVLRYLCLLPLWLLPRLPFVVHWMFVCKLEFRIQIGGIRICCAISVATQCWCGMLTCAVI